MSWSIIEQSQTGEVQYIIASSSQTINSGSTSLFNVSGYTKGTISGVGAGATAEMKVEGSNDGTNFFDLSPSIVTGLSGIVTWSVPIKFVRVTAIAAVNITTILLMAAAGGSGNLSAGGGGGGSAYAAGSDKEIQFNDGGFFGGASGALYDKTANSNIGQVLLGGNPSDAPTFGDLEMNPILSFQADTNTGMFFTSVNPAGVGTPSSAPSNISFPVDGNEALRIASTNQEDLPTLAINGCVDSGIFEPGSNNIGISAGGVEICRATSQMFPPPALNVKGFRVGKVGVPMALVRISDPIANSWEDGHEGDSTKLWFSPSDFFPSLDAPLTLGVSGGFSNATYNVSSFDVNRGPTRSISFGGTTSAPSLTQILGGLTSSILSNITGAVNTTVTGLSQSTTSGIGIGAFFTLITTLGAVTSVTASSSGSNYVSGDTITFTEADLQATSFGGGTSGDLVITLAAADITATALCAMKIIPKGFQIAEGDAFIFTNSSGGGAALVDIPDTHLVIHSQILNTVTGISANPPLFSNTSYTTNVAAALNAGGAVVGNGLTSICLYWDPGQQLAVGSGNRVLLGAYVEMTRI